MSEALSIIIEMILAFGIVALLLVADHVIVTPYARRRGAVATVRERTAGTDFPAVQTRTGAGGLDVLGPMSNRIPAGWTVIKGLRDSGA